MTAPAVDVVHSAFAHGCELVESFGGVGNVDVHEREIALVGNALQIVPVQCHADAIWLVTCLVNNADLAWFAPDPCRHQLVLFPWGIQVIC